MNRLALMVLRNILRVPGAYWKLCHYAKHTEEYSEEEKYKHIRYIFKRAVNSGNINLEVYGTENIPDENGFLLYANHQGLFDIIAITAAMEKPWAAVLKKELYTIPFMKQVVDCTKSFPMDREDLRQSMQVIKNVIKEVEGGRNYLIFPEGTRSKNGNQMLEFHGGSFKCATKAKCPILPIALIDSYKVLDQKGSKLVTVQIHFLEPIPYEEYKELNTVELAEMVHSKIEKVVIDSEKK
ncbi:MAG: 1-acyl-sn-glycerol-3-phosphate acyltransferase [Lachnospiraceae bacterium]|nr:1-acyl-sn-glycerol-3-phosphate acyltransferase [Lachnospiraceae bacterium]